MGQSYGSFDNAYAASGFRDLETFYSGAGGTGAAVATEIFTPTAGGGYTGAINGVTYQVKTVNADGSYDVLTDAGGTIWGQSYGSTDTAYAATGSRELLTFYSGVGATGSVVATETFTADGGYAGVLNGATYQVKTVNADGSYDILTNAGGTIFAKSYGSSDNAYTTSGVRDLESFYSGVGGTGSVVATENFTANGGYAGALNGVLYQVKTVNADLSYNVQTYKAGTYAGQVYASFAISYSPAGKATTETYYSSGAVVMGVVQLAENDDPNLRDAAFIAANDGRRRRSRRNLRRWRCRRSMPAQLRPSGWLP